MGTAGMKNAGLVVLAVAVLVMGWRLVEVTREKRSIEEQARTRSGELQVRLKASGDALEQVQSAHDIAMERMQELEAEFVQEQAGRAAAVEAEEALFAKYAELENALAERRASDKQREGRLQTLRATHEELASERDRFATELQSARSISSAENTRLSAELRKGHSRVDQLVAERDDLRTRAVELENAGDGTRDELARVRKSLAKERDGAAALSVQLTRERSEKSRIEQENEGRLQTLRATHEELASERDRLMAERDRFATELQSTRSISGAENTRLSAELRKAHSRVDQLVAERDDLRTRAVELENAEDGTRDELARVRKSLAKERDGAAALSVQLTRERSEKSRIEQENRELLANFDTIERKRSDLRAEFEAMANERRRLILRLNELEGTTFALRRTASTTAGELGRAQSMAADLNTRYEKLLTEKAKLNHLNDARLTEIERIRVALEDAQRDVARLTNAHGIYTINPTFPICHPNSWNSYHFPTAKGTVSPMQPSDGMILVIGPRLEGHSVIFLAIQTHLSCRFLLAVDSLGLRRSGSSSQIINQAQDFPEPVPRHRHLSQLERNVAAMSDNLGPDLHQLVAQRRHRPVLHLLRQSQCPHEVAQIVGQGVEAGAERLCCGTCDMTDGSS